MYRPLHAASGRLLPLTFALIFACATAGAEFIVTGHSRPGAATLAAEGTDAAELRIGDRVTEGRVTVRGGAQLMLFEPSGVVVVLLEHTELDVRPDPIRGETLLHLHTGRAMTLSDRPAGAAPALFVVLTLAADEGGQAFVPIVAGQILIAADERGARVGFVGSAPGDSLEIEFGDEAVRITGGQRVELSATEPAEIGDIGILALELGFEADFGRELGVEAARHSRGAVEINLFNNIILWDRFAESRYVTARIQEPPFNPEIRQTVQSVTLPARTTVRVERPVTTPFPAANEVPFLSPAAASVQNVRNVGQGVTAIELNRSAANLLIATGSRGLGFGGLRQLTVPGFTGGTRTVGPPGLGAQQARN